MMRDRFYGHDYDRMPMHNNTYGSVEYFAMLAIRLVIVAVFVWAAVMVVKYIVKYLAKHSVSHTETPDEIAKRRLASGEITASEYEELKKHLK